MWYSSPRNPGFILHDLSLPLIGSYAVRCWYPFRGMKRAIGERHAASRFKLSPHFICFAPHVYIVSFRSLRARDRPLATACSPHIAFCFTSWSMNHATGEEEMQPVVGNMKTASRRFVLTSSAASLISIWPPFRGIKRATGQRRAARR